jgi:hypothetical protein
MTTRISNDGPHSNVNVLPTAVRVTPQPAAPFKSVLSATTSAVLDGAEATVRRLPGGEILAAAVRPGTTSDSPFFAGSAGASGTLGLGAPGGSTSPTDPAASAGGANPGIESTLAQQSQDTMYYLSLQLRMQDENRYYTTMSNTLKARHDTVKNSISNLR